ncbi:Uncharacterised protein g10891 [Pycnogonum litorale]
MALSPSKRNLFRNRNSKADKSLKVKVKRAPARSIIGRIADAVLPLCMRSCVCSRQRSINQSNQSVCEANGIYLNLRRNDAKRQDATDAEDGKMSKDVMNIQLNDIPYIDCDEYVEMVGTKPENIGNDPNNVRSNISNSQYELIQMH